MHMMSALTPARMGINRSKFMARLGVAERSNPKKFMSSECILFISPAHIDAA